MANPLLVGPSHKIPNLQTNDIGEKPQFMGNTIKSNPN